MDKNETPSEAKDDNEDKAQQSDADKPRKRKPKKDN